MPGRATYPNVDDVVSLLTAHGWTVGTALRAECGNAIAAAIADFERAIDRRLLAESETERAYDPPTGQDGRLFIHDLAERPSSVVYQPEGSEAQTLTYRTDYVLEPTNAAADGEPYTMLRFTRRRWRSPIPAALLQSILVTGLHAYSTSIPDDAWDAIRWSAAARLWSSVRSGVTGNRLSIAQADRREEFGIETWTGLLEAWVGKDGYGGHYGRAVGKYKRLSL